MTQGISRATDLPAGSSHSSTKSFQVVRHPLHVNKVQISRRHDPRLRPRGLCFGRLFSSSWSVEVRLIHI